MVILGLNIFHGDSSACLMKDGKIISAAEEERFTRIKHFSGFPLNAINYCLSNSNLSIEEVETISVNFNSKYNLKNKIVFMLKNFLSTNFFPRLTLTVKKNSLDRIIYQNYNKKVKFKTDHIPHHQAHIASSYLCSGFKDSIGFSYDGAGDFSTTEIFLCRDNKIELIEKVLYPHSLGIFYQAFTQFLGFKNYGEEYKVMGLAAYGEPLYKNRVYQLLEISNNKNSFFELKLKYYNHYKETFSYYVATGSPFFDNLFSAEFENLFGPARNINEPVTKFHKDLAASMQKVFEEVVINKLNEVHKIYNIDTLCMAGGCAFNSSLNGKILKQTKYKNIYISPNVGDAGGAIGAALITSSFNDQKFKNTKMVNPFLGPKYSNDYIKKNIISILEKSKDDFNFRYVDNFDELNNEVCQFLINRKIVGWFQDEMEWGPRSLGNRCILADPRLEDVKDIINSKIKRREEFRPFAPSILHDHKDDYFDLENITDSPFMTMVVIAKERANKEVPGVVHVDKTSRVQTVTKEFNSKFYSLIEKFYELTGVPILLNTSLNVNGPISRDPNDALEVFTKTNMDSIVLENWIISKK